MLGKLARPVWGWAYGQFIGPNILTEKTRVLRRVNLYNLNGSLLVNQFGADIFSAPNRFHVDKLAEQKSLDQDSGPLSSNCQHPRTQDLTGKRSSESRDEFREIDSERRRRQGVRRETSTVFWKSDGSNHFFLRFVRSSSIGVVIAYVYGVV